MAKKTSEKAQESQASRGSAGAGGTTESTEHGNGNGNGRVSAGTALGGRELLASPDEIAARAYEIYEREGRSDGRAMDHWLKAESELRAEKQNRSASAPNPQPRQDSPRSARQLQETTSEVSRPGSAQ